MDRCVWDQTNILLFPETTRLLRELEVPCMEAFFARMTPHSKIRAHSDYCNFALTAHLGVDVPEGQCWIRVGNDTREWRNGGMLVFDTSIMHDAVNDGDRMRYILMLRVFHPELSSTEVAAIRSIFNYLDDPLLLEHDILSLAPELVRSPPRAAPAPAPTPVPVGLGGDGKNRAARRGHKPAPSTGIAPKSH
jgi:aspartate beta-hydroxylase